MTGNPYSSPVERQTKMPLDLSWGMMLVGVYGALPALVGVGCVLAFFVFEMNAVLLAGAVLFGGLGAASMTAFFFIIRHKNTFLAKLLGCGMSLIAVPCIYNVVQILSGTAGFEDFSLLGNGLIGSLNVASALILFSFKDYKITPRQST